MFSLPGNFSAERLDVLAERPASAVQLTRLFRFLIDTSLIESDRSSWRPRQQRPMHQSAPVPQDHGNHRTCCILWQQLSSAQSAWFIWPKRHIMSTQRMRYIDTGRSIHLAKGAAGGKTGVRRKHGRRI